MLNYFSKISYNGATLTNLTERVIAIEQALSKFDVYYEYTIKDGERPDTVAYDYYGSSDYTWLILLTNKIYDVYYQWPLTYNQFLSYMRAKYGNDFFTMKSVISHYVHNEHDYIMTVDTFNNSTVEQREGWQSISVYDYEEEQNESKRYIKLISNRFVSQIDQEMQELFA